jgi:hypothetical protein
MRRRRNLLKITAPLPLINIYQSNETTFSQIHLAGQYLHVKVPKPEISGSSFFTWPVILEHKNLCTQRTQKLSKNVYKFWFKLSMYVCTI